MLMGVPSTTIRDTSQVSISHRNRNERILTNDDEAHSFQWLNFFTPDGQELAITTWDFDKRTYRLFFIDIESRATRSLRGVEKITESDISADGRFIAFEKTPGFEKNIHIVGSDGRGEKPILPPNASPDFLVIRMYPRWAPDSKRLMFVEDRFDIIVNEGGIAFFFHNLLALIYNFC